MHSLPVRVHPAVSTVVAAALALAGGCAGDEPPDLGEATEAVHSPHLGDPLPGLDPELLDLFFVGEAEFERDLTVADGLGPLFIERSCVACHELGGVGGADRGLDENRAPRRPSSS